jgi:hypothetical protein
MVTPTPVMDTSPELRTRAGSVAQDWPRLAAYLAEQGLELALDPPPQQFVRSTR